MKYESRRTITLNTVEDLFDPYQYYLRWCTHKYITSLNPTVNIPRRIEPKLMHVLMAYYDRENIQEHNGEIATIPEDFQEVFGGDADVHWIYDYELPDFTGLRPRHPASIRSAQRLIWLDAFMQAHLANFRHIDLGSL